MFEGIDNGIVRGSRFVAEVVGEVEPVGGNWDVYTVKTDGTGLVRLDYQVLLLTYLQLSAFVSVFTGDEGEFHLGIDIPPMAGVEGLENGVTVVPQRVQLGLWLSLKV